MYMSQLSLEAMARIIEFGEAEAYADVWRAAPADFAASHGLRLEQIGSAVAITMQAVDIILMNRVVGLGLKEPATEWMVDDIVVRYRSAGIQNFAVQLSLAAQPSALPEWLARRGLQRQDNWAKVYRGPTPPPEISTDLRIERIGPEQAVAFAEVVCVAFGMPDFLIPWLAAPVGRPGWQHYLAFDGSIPVATGALFVQGDVGWLGVGSTLPAYRRRGAQGAIMAQRIRDGQAMGCRWIITETGEDRPDQPNPSYHNMLRTGFTLAYLRPNYIFHAKN
jgi:hypothetical protein